MQKNFVFAKMIEKLWYTFFQQKLIFEIHMKSKETVTKFNKIDDNVQL